MSQRLKEVVIPVTPDGRFKRDEGKKFLLEEMPASVGEEWAIRAAGVACRSGTDIPESIMAAGWAAVAFMGLRAIMSGPWEEVKPLLAEMMSCVKRVEPAATRPLVENDIEEIATRVYLRDEVFKLHANFSIIETMSRVISLLGEVPGQDSPTTPTSQETSE